MAEEAATRYAVVTGSNKGIGLETVRQLASKGVKVVLTARDEKKGLEAVQKLKDSGLSDLLLFHQLDPPTTLKLTSSILAQLRRCHGSFVRHLPHSLSLKPNPQRATTPPSSCLVPETEPRNP
ncbi:(+)-neomenthol dehydrogenase [Quercus suber]|uniref:(+)-neomenthol dehydrogenase n=1 Tax=Quercus suber TaxID=58331 RepID=A0AAW0IW14_QUESU